MQIAEQTLDSREVADMVGKGHKELLRDIRRYCEQLGESKIALTDFFTESTYTTAQNKVMPCYLVTKKGCEFIAHKLTGVKGTAFTAKYINRFHEMEEQLQRENHMDWYVNDVRVFQHREFGILRTLKLDGQDYFIGKDATRSLGYVNNTDTLKKRVSDSEKCYVRICDGKMDRNMVAVTRKGLDELIRTGQLPLASKYNDWIQNQVYPILDKQEIREPEKKAQEKKLAERAEMVPTTSTVEPVPRPSGSEVVDVPENIKMQKALQELKDYMTAFDVMLREYNRYMKVEDFERTKSSVEKVWLGVVGKFSNLRELKPNVVVKRGY